MLSHIYSLRCYDVQKGLTNNCFLERESRRNVFPQKRVVPVTRVFLAIAEKANS